MNAPFPHPLAGAPAGEVDFLHLAENLREVFYVTDPANSRTLYVNPAYERVWGHSRESLYERPESWMEPIVEGDREHVLGANARRETGERYEKRFRIVRPDGSVRWIRSSGFPIRDRRGAVLFAGFAEDVTEEVALRASLRESQRRFDDMLGNMELISMTLDAAARITYCNDHLLRLTGWTAREILGRDWMETFIPAEQVDTMRAVFGSLIGSSPSSRHHENEIVTRSGERRMVRWSNSLLRSAGGEVVGCASVGEDITERRRAEDALRRLNVELEARVAERTAALEQANAELAAANRELEFFAYSVSHDLRAPLRAIEGYSRILADEHAAELPPEPAHFLRRIHANVGRMDRMIEDMLALARAGKHVLQRRRVDLGRILAETLESFHGEIEARGVELRIGELPACSADGHLVASVFQNLLSNALKYTAMRRHAVIEVGGEVRGGEALVHVKDNGAGFEMAQAGRIFDAFQRLHSSTQFEGTGIGLAVVRRIVERHGGRVWAEGEPDRGAAFHFTLPSAA